MGLALSPVLFPDLPRSAFPRPAGLRASWRSLRRAIGVTLGSLMIAFGAVFAILPGHLGLPIVLVGLGLALRNSFAARRQFLRLQRRWPNWVFPVRRLLRPQPEVAPVFWHSLLRTERFLLGRAKNRRGLRHLRRAVKIWVKRDGRSLDFLVRLDVELAGAAMPRLSR